MRPLPGTTWEWMLSHSIIGAGATQGTAAKSRGGWGWWWAHAEPRGAAVGSGCYKHNSGSHGHGRPCACRRPRGCRNAVFPGQMELFKVMGTTSRAREHLRFLPPVGQPPVSSRCRPAATLLPAPRPTQQHGQGLWGSSSSGLLSLRRPRRSQAQGWLLPPPPPVPRTPPSRAPLSPSLLLSLSDLMTSTWASGILSQASQHCLKSPNLEEI